MNNDLIPFEIETQRVVQLLAKQIYQSPLALLRENTQNAFDAIRQRLYIDAEFTPIIEIELGANLVSISDNGVGMTSKELQDHYWTAGRSSKNNEEARAAGVVGTFGIGAMANFGIADRLTVETESVKSKARTICYAEREKLDLKRDCIEREIAEPTGNPGTKITAHIVAGEEIDILSARDYIVEFVSLVDIPVRVNGEIVSQKGVEDLIPRVAEAWKRNKTHCDIGTRMTGEVEIVISNNADIWLHITNIVWDSAPLPGKLVLRTGHSNLRTFRNGFGLATASVASSYHFGGLADLEILEPTAGREAITVDGLQLLQLMMKEIDQFASEMLAGIDECDSSTAFMHWIVNHSRYDLCGKLKMIIQPGERIRLEEVETQSKARTMLLYKGSDQGVVNTHASEDAPLLILARNNPRRHCEQEFLKALANVETISDCPVVKNRRQVGQLSIAESGLSFRVDSILRSDYFVKCTVEFGNISHGLPVLIEKSAQGINIVLNPEGQTVQILTRIYDNEFEAFSSMTKDFVRSVLFPKLADHVPSSTRQGAEAFLRAIRKSPEAFELADDDLGSLPSIWKDYEEGQITLNQAVERSRSAVQSSVQEVTEAVNADEVVPDVIQNEQAFAEVVDTAQNLEPSPGITRIELSSVHKLLVIDENDTALRGYRCFLTITDKVRNEMGEFFLQPHFTSIVWGGQKTLFIFMHHSREFGLYYDLQTREMVSAPSGGGVYPTCSIVLKDRVYIPIPEEISASFVPNPGEIKRFEVRADILRASD